MNTKICVLTALAACIGLLLTGFSAGLVGSSVTLSSSGVVQQTSTGTYSYIISVSGSNYQMTNGTTGQIDYQSTNATQVVNAAIGNLTQGGNILIKAGTYNLKGSIIARGINDINLYFEEDAILFVSNGMNAAAIYLWNCNNWLIQNPTINGNAANQVVTDQGGEANEVDGILVNGVSNNNHVDRANITNCGLMGVRFGDFTAPSINNKVTNSLFTFCGWNGISLCINSTTNYAENNEVAYCSDVGITTWGTFNVIQNNYVHDMNGTSGSINTQYGIAIEGGYSNIVKQNQINNTYVGIYNTGFNNNTISDNTITLSTNGLNMDSSCFNEIIGNHISQIAYTGINLDATSNNNTVSLNIVYDCSYGDATHYGNGINIHGNSNFLSENQVYDTRVGAARTQSFGIAIVSGATDNILTNNNIYNNLAGTISNAGTGTISHNNILDGVWTA